MVSDEARRILREYQSRQLRVPQGFYSVTRPGILFAYQQRVRNVLRLWKGYGLPPFSKTRLLEIGCGTGDWLVDFESWGIPLANLGGVELGPERAARAKRRLGAGYDSLMQPVLGADIRIGDASVLPWNDESFDVVLQSTVFSSVLDPTMKTAIAREMERVLKPGGWILWYDFFIDNPYNRNVQGIPLREIKTLFPQCQGGVHRITLAPPLSRLLAPISWTMAMLLEKTRILNTHYLGFLRKLDSH